MTFKIKEKFVHKTQKSYSHHCLRSLIVTLVIFSTSPSFAYKFDEMSCSLNGSVRALYIKIENPQSEVPCEVVENKNINSPESATSLWHAGDDAGYCKKMLVNYVEKLRGLGFECWETGESEVIRQSASIEGPE